MATSWTGSNLPTLGEIGTFDSTSGTNAVGLTADYSLGEILISTITANQTFNASPGFALTLGGVAGVGIDMSSVSNGTNSLTNNLTTFLGGSQSWNVAAGRTLTLSYAGNTTSPGSFSGGITLGAGGLTISGVNAGGTGLISATAGTVTISAAQLLLSGGLTVGGSSSASLSANNAGGTGTVTVNTSGTFTTTAAAALQNNTVSLTAAGTFTLAASSSIGALTGSLGFTPTTALTLGFNNASPAAYTGAIAGSATLTKIGSGTQILNGLNTSTGSITVNGAGGTLEFGGASNVSNGSVNVNAGTLKLNFNSGGAGATDLLKVTSALTLGGGTLLVQGKDSAPTAAQTFASTTVTRIYPVNAVC